MWLGFSMLVAANAAEKQTAPLQTQAPVVLLIDGDNGGVLFEKDSGRKIIPGDMAKIMTAEVVFDALKRRQITLDSEFIISERAWQRGRGGSMFAILKSHIRVEDLLRGITVLSTNDAAIALAEGLAGSEDEFVQKMNERSRSIGMNDSSFRNATGNEIEGQVTTARDLAKLASYIIAQYPDFYPLYAEKEFTWSKITQLNKNPLLTMDVGADGVKAARPTEDGYALVVSAVNDGRRVIAVVAGLDDRLDSIKETHKILQWAFQSFVSRSLFLAGETIAEARVFGGEWGTVPLIAQRPVKILWREGSIERISMHIDYEGPLLAPVQKGSLVGELKVMKGKDLVVVVPVYAGADIDSGTMFQRGTDAIGEFADRAFYGLWDRMLVLMKKRL